MLGRALGPAMRRSQSSGNRIDVELLTLIEEIDTFGRAWRASAIGSSELTAAIPG
jgi:hypothetical protein